MAYSTIHHVAIKGVSASVPLTIVTQCRSQYGSSMLTSIGCGFGIGLSWGSVYFVTDRIVVPELIEI